MQSDLRSRILKQLTTLPSELVDIPEWNAKIEVRGQMAGDYIDLARSVSQDGKVDSKTLTFQTVIATAFDPESGERVFQTADMDMLKQAPANIVNRLFSASMRVNGAETPERVAADLKDVPTDDST
jgi:hypothetical protein